MRGDWDDEGGQGREGGECCEDGEGGERHRHRFTSLFQRLRDQIDVDAMADVVSGVSQVLLMLLLN